jgi:peptidyl-prolyl cis-trans isomerase B (cyclophilin B)
MMRIILLIVLIVMGLALATSAQDAETREAAKANARPSEKVAKAEPFDGASVEKMAAQCVVLDTEAGEISVEMFPEHAPESVRNFLNIIALGYLDTTTFSRVVPGFVIQGGDFWSRAGEVTYEIGTRARRSVPDEPNKILHERGILSMARGDEANTATTNFFILVGDAPHLDGTFAAFGRVTKGMDVVDAINGAKISDEKPEKPVRIKAAKVAPCSRND